MSAGNDEEQEMRAAYLKWVRTRSAAPEMLELLRNYAKGRESMSMTRRMADQLHEKTEALLKRIDEP